MFPSPIINNIYLHGSLCWFAKFWGVFLSADRVIIPFISSVLGIILPYEATSKLPVLFFITFPFLFWMLCISAMCSCISDILFVCTEYALSGVQLFYQTVRTMEDRKNLDLSLSYTRLSFNGRSPLNGSHTN